MLLARPCGFPAVRRRAMLSRKSEHDEEAGKTMQGSLRRRGPAGGPGAWGVHHRRRHPARPALSVVWRAILGRETPQAELLQVRRRACRGRRVSTPEQGRIHREACQGAMSKALVAIGQAGFVPATRVTLREFLLTSGCPPSKDSAAHHLRKRQGPLRRTHHPPLGCRAAEKLAGLSDQRPLRISSSAGSRRPAGGLSSASVRRVQRCPASRLPRRRALGTAHG